MDLEEEEEQEVINGGDHKSGEVKGRGMLQVSLKGEFDLIFSGL